MGVGACSGNRGEWPAAWIDIGGLSGVEKPSTLSRRQLNREHENDMLEKKLACGWQALHEASRR